MVPEEKVKGEIKYTLVYSCALCPPGFEAPSSAAWGEHMKAVHDLSVFGIATLALASHLNYGGGQYQLNHNIVLDGKVIGWKSSTGMREKKPRKKT